LERIVPLTNVGMHEIRDEISGSDIRLRYESKKSINELSKLEAILPCLIPIGNLEHSLVNALYKSEIETAAIDQRFKYHAIINFIP
jgi:hypothetical protein